MKSSTLPILLPFLSVGFCTPMSDYTRPKSTPGILLPVETIAQLDTVPTWLENIAVRANGDLLATQLTPAPVLYTVRNPYSGHAIVEISYQWQEPNVAKLLGIAETLPDTFNIIAGNATANSTGYAGTFSVWEAKYESSKSSKSSKPAVRKIANIPEAMFLNGIVSLPSHPEIVLIPDSQFGLLFRLDTRTGKSEIIADRPEFKPFPERRNQTVGFGINGVRIRDEYLYFSNSDLVTIFRVLVTQEGYIGEKSKAPVEVYVDLGITTIFLDDFTFSEDGTLWATTNLGNTVLTVSPDGRKIQEVAGAIGQLTVAGGTAGAFGRTINDKNLLYVSTAGGLAAPVNGTVIEPGKIVAVDTKTYVC